MENENVWYRKGSQISRIFQNDSTSFFQNYYYLFQDGGLYHIETSPLICTANQ